MTITIAFIISIIGNYVGLESAGVILFIMPFYFAYNLMKMKKKYPNADKASTEGKYIGKLMILTVMSIVLIIFVLIAFIIFIY